MINAHMQNKIFHLALSSIAALPDRNLAVNINIFRVFLQNVQRIWASQSHWISRIWSL